MPTPGENTTSATLNFAADGQSMWGSGEALTVNYNLPIVGFSTGNISASIAGAELTAYLGAELVASLSGTAGSISVNYPVSANITAPTTVAPGEQFTVDTSDLGLVTSGGSVSHLISTGFPSLSASLDLDVSGGVSAGGSLDILGYTVPTFSYSAGFTSDFTLASLQTSGSETVPISGLSDTSITFAIPTTESGTTKVVSGGTATILPTISAAEIASPDIISAHTDLATDLAQLLEIEDFPSGSFLDGAITYNLLSAGLSGTVEAIQNFSFIPTGVSVDITTPWGASEVVPLGGKATFTVPNGWPTSSGANLTTTYLLSGNLESQNGISGTITLGVQALSASFFGDSIGPVYSHSFSIGTGPLYIYTPGGSSGFPLENIELQTSGSTNANSVDVTLAASEMITVPGGGTVDIQGFTAEGRGLVQGGIDAVSGTTTATNIYNGSGTATSASGKLNIEVTSKAGTLDLPTGFAVGILQPGSGNATLVGNATDVLLAAVPNSGGGVDTLSSTDNHDTLVGAQDGLVNFDIKAGFSGEIAGVGLYDAIDVQNLAWTSNTLLTVNSSTNVLTLSNGGNVDNIQIDPVENLSGQVFSVWPDGKSGTDIYFGVVFPAGVTINYGAGTVSSSILVLSGGTVTAQDGAQIIGTILDGGYAAVSSGGTATSTTVENGGSEAVFVHGFALSTTVVSANLTVSSGGHATSTTVNHGGLDVSGLANVTVLNNFANEDVAAGGTDVGAEVNSGGAQDVGSGGTAIDAVIAFGGTQEVLPGGIASGASIAGYQEVGYKALSGGSVISTQVLGGGSEVVFKGGRATDTTVDAGGLLTVSSQGIAVSATLAANASLVVSSGGTAIDPQLAVGATLTVKAGGLVSGGFTSGKATILGSAVLFQVAGTVSSGGTEKSGTAGSAPIPLGGTEIVSSGGVVVSGRVDIGGTEILSAGAKGRDAQIDSGGLVIVSASATFSATSDGGSENLRGIDISNFVGTSEGTYSPQLTVFAGGVASDTQIGRRGDVIAQSGGTVISALIDSAGSLELKSGAVLSGTVKMNGAGTLQIDGTTMPTNTISGLFVNDGTLVLRGVAPVSGATVAVVSGTKLDITESGVVHQLNINSTAVTSATNDLPNNTTIELGPDTHGGKGGINAGTELSIIGGSELDLAAQNNATVYLAANDTVDASFASNAAIYGASDTFIIGGPSDTIYLSALTVHGGGATIVNALSPVISSYTSKGKTVTATVPTVHDTVFGFNAGVDTVQFAGSSTATMSAVLATAHQVSMTVSGTTITGTTVSFTDHSTVTFMGYTLHEVTSGFFS